MGHLKEKASGCGKNFFPNAKIASVDIKTTREVEEINGIKFFEGCQSSNEIKEKVKEQFPEGFDLIIDDASHQNELTIQTFKNYWELVKDGGVFIIEDLHCSFSSCTSNTRLDAETNKTPLGYLKGLIKDVNFNYHFLGIKDRFPIYRRNRKDFETRYDAKRDRLTPIYKYRLYIIWQWNMRNTQRVVKMIGN